MANVDNPRRPSAIRLFFHDLKNAGGDGSARSIALGVVAVIGICGATSGALIFLSQNTPILDVLGIR